MGMLTSVTAGSIGGRFGSAVQRFTLGLVRDGMVDDVASDAHGPALGRPPRLDAELRSRGWGALVEHCCDAVPAAVLAGTPVPATLPPRRQGVWSRLRR
jgi:protein-tyrosine phosphatase